MPLLNSVRNVSEQNNIINQLNAFIAALEKYPSYTLDVNVESNPFGLLLLLLKKFHVTEDEIIEWLAKYIKYSLPVIELGVKGILLSNLKNLISCSIDPRIPASARTEGFTFDISQIDPCFMLSSSPLDERNNQLYFGVDEATSPYNLLRTKDFNAFLWYIIHKGKYPTPSYISTDNYSGFFQNNYNATIIQNKSSKKADNIWDVTELQYNLDNQGILLGNSFRQKKYNSISVCAFLERDEITNQIKYNCLFPIGCNWNRTNYYANRATYFNFLDPTNKMDEITNIRDYNQDIPLCDLHYIQTSSEEQTDIFKNVSEYKYLNNKINLKILPKPFVHVPHIGQKALYPIYILFNSKGEPDKNGRLSLNSTKLVCQGVIDGTVTYKIDGNNNTELQVFSDGSYQLTSTQDLSVLQECYPALTIYEFNYDFIMSMRLYDAKVVATQLINSLYNFKLGLSMNLGMSNVQIEGSERIIKIIENIIESNDNESSDCFFTFDNSQYEQMAYNAELKRANQIPFGDSTHDNTLLEDEIKEMLNKFGDASTLEESTEALTNLISQISASIEQEGTDANNVLNTTFKVNNDIISNLIKNLVMIIVNTLLSPKVLLILLINQELCGKINTKALSLEEILNSMTNLIVEIVKEIRDMILQALFEFVKTKIAELLSVLRDALLLEQINNYRTLMKLLLKECSIALGKQQLLDTNLDNVNYADIENVLNEPPIKNC